MLTIIAYLLYKKQFKIAIKKADLTNLSALACTINGVQISGRLWMFVDDQASFKWVALDKQGL